MRSKLAKLLRIVCMGVAALGLTTACASVQPWEREALAAGPMALDDRPCHRFERNSEAYREGAIGANGGKSGAGCGCS